MLEDQKYQVAPTTLLDSFSSMLKKSAIWIAESEVLATKMSKIEEPVDSSSDRKQLRCSRSAHPRLNI